MTGPYNRLVGANASGELPPQVANTLHGDAWLPAPYTADISGTYEIDATKPVQVLTVTGAVTISLPTVPAGKTTPITVTIVKGGTDYAATLPDGDSTPACKWTQGEPPDLTGASTENDLFFTADEVRGWRGYWPGEAMA